jgi:hypothetical protein
MLLSTLAFSFAICVVSTGLFISSMCGQSQGEKNRIHFEVHSVGDGAINKN